MEKRIISFSPPDISDLEIQEVAEALRSGWITTGPRVTLQEGMPRSMMEAMAAGLPCIASKIRGNVDLIENGKGGFLCMPTDSDAFAQAIRLCTYDVRKKFGRVLQLFLLLLLP